MTATDLHFVTRARVGSRTIPTSDAAVRALLNARALSDDAFDGVDPFLFESITSNNSVDFYGTRMHETSLRNYADDLVAGIAFQHSHDYREFVGRSLTGEFQIPGGKSDDGVPLQQTRGLFYTVPGLKLGSMATDDFIKGVRAGIISDVSIGFWASDYRCSICASSLWDCRHIPGVDYDQGGKSVRAFAWVHDAHISEVSAVYDGATEGCAIVKARQLAADGAIDERTIARLEQRYRVDLPHRTTFASPGVPTSVKANTGTFDLTALETERQRLAPMGIAIKDGADVVRVIAKLGDEITSLRHRVRVCESELAGQRKDGIPPVDSLFPKLLERDDPFWFSG